MLFDAHFVEGAVDEEEGDDEEDDAEPGCHAAEAFADGDFHGEDAEEGGELDDGVQCHGGGVLEGVADGVAHDGGVVELGALGLHVDFNDFLGVVPGAAGVGHEDGLEEAEDGDGDEVGDEEADGVLTSDALGRGEAGEGEGEAEDGDEDVDHAALGVVGADLDDFLALLDVGLLGGVGVELDVVLDVFDGTVGAGGDSLHGGAGEPVDDTAAEDEAEDGVGVEHVEDALGLDAEGLLDHEDEGEDHGGGADDGGADEDGLGSGLEGVACAVVGLEVVFGFLEVGFEAEFGLDFLGGFLDVVLDEGELVDGLCVVGHGAVGVDGDGDRAHAEHTEGDEAEGEDGVVGAEDFADAEEGGGEVGDDHEDEEDDAGPGGAHVAGHETGAARRL